jgi:hypothetical protein
MLPQVRPATHFAPPDHDLGGAFAGIDDGGSEMVAFSLSYNRSVFPRSI